MPMTAMEVVRSPEDQAKHEAWYERQFRLDVMKLAVAATGVEKDPDNVAAMYKKMISLLE